MLLLLAVFFSQCMHDCRVLRYDFYDKIKMYQGTVRIREIDLGRKQSYSVEHMPCKICLGLGRKHRSYSATFPSEIRSEIAHFRRSPFQSFLTRNEPSFRTIPCIRLGATPAAHQCALHGCLCWSVCFTTVHLRSGQTALMNLLLKQKINPNLTAS